MQAGSRRYETLLLAILTLSLGFTIFDRVAVNLLSPFIVADLGLDNAELGLLSSALSVTLAVSGYVFGSASDRLSSRKAILCGALFVFSLLSSVSGLAVSLATLIGARLLMGVTEGPILPLSYSIVAIESAPQRRAFNMGFLANFATCLIGGVVGPIVLTQLGGTLGWRAAFFVTGIPGLVATALILFLVREPPQRATLAPEGDAAPARQDRGRNVVLCMLLACGLYTWLLVTLAFLPIYLVRVVGMTPTDMGLVSAVNGISGCTCAIFATWLADRIGRKPTLILFCLIGLLVPLAALFLHGQIVLMSAIMFLGWSSIGCSPLYAGTIPSESVNPAHVARTLALIIGVGEIFAGGLMPTVAGWAADRWGLTAPLWIVFGATALSALVACFIEETLPTRATRRQAAPVPTAVPATD